MAATTTSAASNGNLELDYDAAADQESNQFVDDLVSRLLEDDSGDLLVNGLNTFFKE